MAKFKGIVSAVILIVIGLAFYYRAGIFGYFSPQLASFEKMAINVAVEEIKKQVNAPPPLVAPPRKAISSSTTAAQLTVSGTIKWTNIERENNGSIPPLLENVVLDRIAQLRIEDMFKYQYFAHVSPSGLDAEMGASQVGYDYLAIGENLALGDFYNNEDLVTAWMNSPGHRANILNSKYEEIGVAVKKGIYDGRLAWIGVQIFGKPASSCPAIDESLKMKITAEQSQLNDMQNNLQTLKTEIENMNPKGRGEYRTYNEKVDEYNSLVISYNIFLTQTKGDVLEYNSEANAFNQCIAN